MRKMRCVAVIQARMGSTRLPGKVLKPLGDRSVLEHVVGRVAKAKSVDALAVVTTYLAEDDVLEVMARKLGVHIFRGPVDDVLARFATASRTLGADDVVRITADCPCIDPGVIDRVVRAHTTSGADYTSNVHPRSFPRGMDVEVMRAQALCEADEGATGPDEREHVTPFVWQQPQRYRLCNVVAEPHEHMPDLRVTLDTDRDYTMLQAVFDLVGHGELRLDDLLHLVRRHPWLREINGGVEQKGMTGS